MGVALEGVAVASGWVLWSVTGSWTVLFGVSWAPPFFVCLFLAHRLWKADDFTVLGDRTGGCFRDAGELRCRRACVAHNAS